MEQAQRLVEAWRIAGVVAWVEISRSKGYHVWVFPKAPVPTAIARKAALAIHQLAEVPADEVNPKSMTYAEGERGNCVRLPYLGAFREDVTRQVMVDSDGQLLTLGEFIEAAEQGRTPVRILSEVALRYVEPQTEMPLSGLEALINNPARFKAKGVGNSGANDAQLIFRGMANVTEGERDNSFWTLACYMAGIGLSLDKALSNQARIYQEQCPDKAGFSQHRALEKVERAYRTRRYFK